MRPVLRILVAASALLLAAGMAAAQSPLGIGTAEPGIPATGVFGPLFAVINHYQQDFYRASTGALKAMRQDPHALSTLVGLSFAYGIFHAAGPGHGKAVISCYMLANETELKRGIIISLVSALLQGLTALAVVSLAFLVLRGTSISLTMATTALERLSFAMIVAFGAFLLVRKLRSLLRRPSTVASHALSAGTQHVHGPDCRHGLIGTDGPARSGFICESCGHSHMPDPQRLHGRFGIREAWSAILAVGIRPCSGALLVLTFSLLNGLYLGGVLSVLAMSLGTAITVAALATLAVCAKGTAFRIAGTESRAGRIIAHAAEFGGALVVLLMGLFLLAASFQ